MVQYVSDDGGNHTAVLVPIKEWHEITAKLNQLDGIKDSNSLLSSKKKPSDYVGILDKETAMQMLRDIEQDRNEWEKRI